MSFRKFELENRLKEDNNLIRAGVLRNDHPLDTSREFQDFLQACRRGDLRYCQEAISNGININARDEFDYTPLVIASLCGHYELVQLLLESGVIADPGSFERERAVYNALNDKIRNLLLSYDYSKSSDSLQPWSSHITSLLVWDSPQISDIVLTLSNEHFSLHKFILCARSPYFMQKLSEAPETTTWKVSPSIPIEALRIVLRYLYLGELPRDLVPPRSAVSEEEVFSGIDKLCRQLELEKLWEEVLSINDRRLARQRHQDEVLRAQAQIEAFFNETVLKHKMIVETAKVADVKWPHHNAIFANCLLRADEPLPSEEEEKDNNDHDQENSIPLDGTTIPIGPTSSHRILNGTSKRIQRSVLFPAHKAFLIRSPYFETMFASDFREAHDTATLHVITVDCTPPVLEIILRFLYTEKFSCPLEHALDLLYTADMLLLEQLKAKAAATISTLGSGNSNVLVDRTHLNQASAPKSKESGTSEPEPEPINVYDVIHAAWDLNIQRLEEFAARYLASRLEDYVETEEFAELIRESAARLKSERHETDTIELLDDIRYYLGERFRLRFEGGGIGELLAGGLEEGEGEQGQRKSKAENGGELGGVRALNGEVVEDEFASDAVNYHVLMEKIDKMLEKLNLGA